MPCVSQMVLQSWDHHTTTHQVALQVCVGLNEACQHLFWSSLYRVLAAGHVPGQAARPTAECPSCCLQGLLDSPGSAALSQQPVETDSCCARTPADCRPGSTQQAGQRYVDDVQASMTTQAQLDAGINCWDMPRSMLPFAVCRACAAICTTTATHQHNQRLCDGMHTMFAAQLACCTVLTAQCQSVSVTVTLLTGQ